MSAEEYDALASEDEAWERAEGLPNCEGWTCQACGADNFIPAGFEPIHLIRAKHQN